MLVDWGPEEAQGLCLSLETLNFVDGNETENQLYKVTLLFSGNITS